MQWKFSRCIEDYQQRHPDGDSLTDLRFKEICEKQTSSCRMQCLVVEDARYGVRRTWRVSYTTLHQAEIIRFLLQQDFLAMQYGVLCATITCTTSTTVGAISRDGCYARLWTSAPCIVDRRNCVCMKCYMHNKRNLHLQATEIPMLPSCCHCSKILI